MPDLVELGMSTPRDRRATLPSRLHAAGPVRQGADRLRRGAQASLPDVWRKTELGTNHIASFGVWRRGERRQAERANRSGSTRWHMPHKSGTAIVLTGVIYEAVNED